MAILVTGSEGLVGRRVCSLLADGGIEARHFDLARSKDEDIRSRDALIEATQGVEGVVHLAAVSRVMWAQRDPDLCQATNVEGLRSLLSCCLDKPSRPWVIFVSSREVYGNPDQLPVDEDAPLRPLNVYARSKRSGELLAMEARAAGLCVNVCRLSNVYGSVHDHPDRVIPAFASAAARGGRMRVEGNDNLFDFTSIVDVGRAMMALIDATRRGEELPPIHFASGVGTTLGQLADLARRYATAPVEIVEAPKRDYDVVGFVGKPERAQQLLGWRAEIPIEAGIRNLIDQFSRQQSVAANLAREPEAAAPAGPGG